MNGNEILRLVDALHRDKNIDIEIVFDGIEQAILSAARKHFGEECEIEVHIDREDGQVSASIAGDALNADEIGELLGRIAAQTAKQVMIQKIREAERDALYEEFSALKSQIITGTVSRVDGGACTVNLGKVDGILPRGEQIPGEGYRTGERVRAVIIDVRKAGSRVKIILSRTHPDLVRRLFELEIPEVAEHVIEVRSLAREAGYRSKVAVSCYDSKIDCVGACVGVRGARIRSIVDELAGERIDIVRWNDSLQVLVPNALQPAEVEDVILCPMLGKVIVLVRDDQLSLAIGKKGQNVRLASKLVGWDIHVMNQERLDEQLDTSVAAFTEVPGVSSELAESLVSQGFFTFDDLSVIEPDQLAELGGLTAEECDKIIAYADAESARIEQEELRARAEAKRTRELEAAIAEAMPQAAVGAAPPGSEAGSEEDEGDGERGPEEPSAEESEPGADEEAAPAEQPPAERPSEAAEPSPAAEPQEARETAALETASAEDALVEQTVAQGRNEGETSDEDEQKQKPEAVTAGPIVGEATSQPELGEEAESQLERPSAADEQESLPERPVDEPSAVGSNDSDTDAGVPAGAPKATTGALRTAGGDETPLKAAEASASDD